MAVTGHALNQLLQQMDRTFSNVTGRACPLSIRRDTIRGRCGWTCLPASAAGSSAAKKGAQHCLACNHSFGLDAEQRCTVSQCHMGISVISVPVPLPEARAQPDIRAVPHTGYRGGVFTAHCAGTVRSWSWITTKWWRWRGRCGCSLRKSWMPGCRCCRSLPGMWPPPEAELETRRGIRPSGGEEVGAGADAARQ